MLFFIIKLINEADWAGKWNVESRKWKMITSETLRPTTPGNFP